MIDFLLGLALGVTAVLLFKGQNPAKQTAELSFFTNLETRITTMLSDAFNQAIARLETVVDAKIAASDTGAQVDAEATAAVSALADKLAPAPAEPQA